MGDLYFWTGYFNHRFNEAIHFIIVPVLCCQLRCPEFYEEDKICSLDFTENLKLQMAYHLLTSI